jgi:hypothetical protein
MGIPGPGPVTGPFSVPGGKRADSPVPPGESKGVPAAGTGDVPVRGPAKGPSVLPPSVTSLISALKLPPGSWSASILSFAKFFSLPLEGNFLNLIRQKVLGAENLGQAPNPASGEPGEAAAGAENAAEFREALSLAALAARAKGVDLPPEALVEYARALLRGRGKNSPDGEADSAEGDRDPGAKPEDGTNNEVPRKTGAETKSRESSREADTSIKDPKTGDRPGKNGGKEAAEESAARGPALRGRILGGQGPLLSLLNRWPEKSGKRWRVLPFAMDGPLDGPLECCLRILLAPQPGTEAYRADCLGLDIRRREKPETAWTFIARTGTGEPAGTRPLSLEVFRRPVPLRAETRALEHELAGLLDLPPDSVRVRAEPFPIFAEDSRDWTLPSVNKEV